jgi:Tim44-like domain
VKLLQGDLAEAWREGDTDYATVAVKFALKDSMVEHASGRIVEGGERSEVTELWTFMRARGGCWLISAIQQLFDTAAPTNGVAPRGGCATSIGSCPVGEYRTALQHRAGGRVSRIWLLTGWSLVRIRPGEPNKSGV